MTDHARPHAVLVILNLPVPDDQRAWSQALALRDDGARVTVVCPAIRGRRPGGERVDGIEIVRFASFEGQGALATAAEGVWTATAAARAVRAALRTSRGVPCMLQIGNPPDLLFPLARWARRRGVRTVYDQRDVVPVLAASRAGFNKLTPVFKGAERQLVAASDVVITPSEEQRARIARLYRRNAVIIRTAEVSAATESVATESAAPRNDRDTVLGYLGVIGEQDGLTDLLDAVALLRADGAGGFRLEVAGDGPALPAARDHATRLGLDGLVTFHGWLGPGEVDTFLSRIDAMTVPDPDNPFNHFCAMNKVTHAMARAIPIALRPLRENSRLVGPHAYLASDMSTRAFADAIAKLLADSPESRAAIASASRDLFEAEHSWARYAQRYVDAVAPGRKR
ncbi:glycosyltransferase [Catenulispora subtropica]|uniref:Glycosyltransferase family 4 protein n=1 Tax=Catenulispora subtropica TaxID=450798 RepID=A0ABN2SZA6_9ACTN